VGRLKPHWESRIWASVAASLVVAPIAIYALVVGGIAKTEIALGVSRGWAIVASIAIALGFVVAFVVFDRSGGDDW
jgi:hypothetical protein